MLGSARVVAGLLLPLLWLSGCNGVSAPPTSGSASSTSTSSSDGTQGRAAPSGEPQQGLARGSVVLEAPPRPPVTLSVEIADTDETRRLGLMFREELADDEGMFFVFERERQQSFWMRNTLIPLDMFFIDAAFNVVGVVENAEPLTDTSRGVDGASQYVLEVNGGFAAKHGFGPGTQVKYTPPGDSGQEIE